MKWISRLGAVMLLALSVSLQAQDLPSHVITRVIALNKDASPPQGAFTPPPSYTQRALQAGKQGEVVLSLLITKKGDVRHVALITGFDKDLDEATRRAIKSWKFQPPIQDGKPTEEWINVRVTFSLK